jgi:NADH-ubiquinone oxidoreductase chain 5
LPLIGSFCTGFGGRYFGFKGSAFLSLFCSLNCLLLCLLAFYEVGFCGAPTYLILTKWISDDLLNINWGFLYDTLTVVILVVISFISFLVHLYSVEYIRYDPHLPRFLCYLSLFTFFILILVTANNFLQIFLGWEGVGLCSYLLINFWFTRIQANKAAIKAIVVNRIGDFGLALGMFCIYSCFDSLDYSVVFAACPFASNLSFFFFYEFDALNLIGFLLFIGAVGKSAQLGLHTWLPDAIEGPTPVSALIHAATIVTAGVFLLGRCSPLLEYATECTQIIIFVGALSAFFASTTGLVQNDIKKVIAYSTCSQLGYIIFACGTSHYNLAIYHLANHAFFKALLFLGAGSVIHGMCDEQDMRKIGGLRRLLPFTYAIMIIGSLSLMGFPFLSGFYSKDAILEAAAAKFTTTGHFAYFLGSLAAFLTAFYSLRLVYLCFLSRPNGYKSVIFGAHESPWIISYPLGILAIPSIFIGYLFKDAFFGFGTPFWGNALYTHPYNSLDYEFLSTSLKLAPVVLSLAGAISAYLLYVYSSQFLFNLKFSVFGRRLYTFLNRKWFFDKVYNDFVSTSVLDFSYKTSYKVVDRGIIEITGPRGLNSVLSGVKTYTNSMQSGSFYHLALYMLCGVAIVYLMCFMVSFKSFYLIFLALLFNTPRKF